MIEKAFLNNLRIPELTKNDIYYLEKLYDKLIEKNFINVDAILEEIDLYVAQMYGFTKEEIEYMIK